MIPNYKKFLNEWNVKQDGTDTPTDVKQDGTGAPTDVKQDGTPTDGTIIKSKKTKKAGTGTGTPTDVKQVKQDGTGAPTDGTGTAPTNIMTPEQIKQIRTNVKNSIDKIHAILTKKPNVQQQTQIKAAAV